MTRIFHVLILCYLLAETHSSHIIDCTTEDCRHTNINCLPNQDCFVLCNKTEACLGGSINCPIQGDCNILCKGGESCRDAQINATQSNGNFNLQCEESTDHCRNIKVYGNILNTSHSNDLNFNISCNGKQRSCAYSYIQCPSNTNCNIQCNSHTSCRWSQIISSNNTNLNIKCNGINSCFDAIFDGSKSLSLDINGCTADKSCLDLTFYCPPNTNGHKNCFIEGNNNIARDNAKGITIYAINGWNDVDINYYGTYTSSHSGTMNCGNDYSISCPIASDKWSCDNDNDYCNFYDNFQNENTENTQNNEEYITTTTTTKSSVNPCERSLYKEDDEIDCYNKISNLPTLQPSILIYTTSPSMYPTLYPTLYDRPRPIRTINSSIRINNNKSKQVEYETDSWTSKMIVGLILIVFVLVFIMVSFIAMYCYCKYRRKTMVLHVQSESKLSKSNYKCIDIDIDIPIDDEEEFKSEIIEDIRHTIKIMRQTEGTLDPYSPHVDDCASSMSKLTSTDNDILISDGNSSLQIQISELMNDKTPKLSDDSNITNISENTANASSDDIIEKNVLFLNPSVQNLYLMPGQNKIQSSETSVSTQTNDHETSASCDTYASPIKPNVFLD